MAGHVERDHPDTLRRASFGQQGEHGAGASAAAEAQQRGHRRIVGEIGVLVFDDG
jgi:hypothetical protein